MMEVSDRDKYVRTQRVSAGVGTYECFVSANDVSHESHQTHPKDRSQKDDGLQNGTAIEREEKSDKGMSVSSV